MSGRKIAVIGGGISGLTAAYILARTDEVTVFEAGDRLGGHADTHLVPEPGGPPVPVDTGFIVYNERTYPLLTRLFRELGVVTQASEMSMSVSCSGCGVQYAGKRGLAGLGAGLRRGGPRYLRMLAEVPRFHRAARRVLASGESRELSLADFLRARGFSAYFTTHFAAPLVGAVWSCPPGVALRYPAGVSVRLPRQPRDAVGFRLAAVAHRDAAARGATSSASRSGWRRSACRRLSLPSAATPTGLQVRDASGEALELRRRGDRHPPRSGAAAARSAHPGGAVGTRRVQLHAQRGGAAHRHKAASAARRRPRVLELLPGLPGQRRRLGTDQDQLLPEPAPRAAAERRRLHRHAERTTGRGPVPRHRSDGLRPPRLHARIGRRAIAACRA